MPQSFEAIHEGRQILFTKLVLVLWNLEIGTKSLSKCEDASKSPEGEKEKKKRIKVNLELNIQAWLWE